MAHAWNGWRKLAIVVAVCGLAVTACSKAGATSSGLTVAISSPANNAKVSEPFTVRVTSNVALGAPSTGDHHVHICIDGASCDTSYQLVYGNSASITGLSPGTHTIEASLRNADHSDAGPSAKITVDVTSGAGTAVTSSPSPTGGYGY